MPHKVVPIALRKRAVDELPELGEWVPIAELEDSAGSFREVQSALSSLTKRMKNHGVTKWPFKARKDDRTDRFVYLMEEATATTVLALARAN